MSSLNSSLNRKAVVGMNAEPRDGDRVVPEIFDEDGVNTLDLDVATAWELVDKVQKATKAAEEAAGR
jgi:hypothetical protein